MSPNKKLYEILVRNDGFSKTELIVPQGKSIVFLIDHASIKRNENNDDIVVVQIVSDDVDNVNRVVVGGYRSKPNSDKLSVKFKIPGEYTFKLYNHPENPPICKIKITEEPPLTFLVTDNGFLPRIIRIEENTTIKWQWSKVSFPHSIYEAEYCDAHTGIFRTTRELATKSLSNNYKRTFKEPGLYYFQTDSKNADVKHLCLVEVHQSFKDHSVEIFDSKFSPTRITIEEGDRVFFSWNKDTCQKRHCIYQIETPLPDHKPEDAYFPVKSGFSWNSPTLNGLIIQKFEKCGVYYFSDATNDECASYIGIIAVKQKPETHILEYDTEERNFGDDLVTMETGDTIFWKWNPQTELIISLIDYSLLRNKKLPVDKCLALGSCDIIDSGLSKSGVRSYNVKSPGIYYFEVNNGKEKFITTLVATSVQKDHKIAITDTEANPKILEVYPEDRVWFVWDETRKPKNIRQVDHQNEIIEGGFLSGSLMESPGTFLEPFDDIGVYFYRSDNINEVLGAIVVVPEPSIQLINVCETGLSPDPIVVHVDDIVIWAFNRPHINDLVLIDNEIDLIKYAELSPNILPRRHLSYSFKEPGVYHFASPSFDLVVDSSSAEATKGLENTIISSVIVDRINDYSSVIVDSNGFHPNVINVEVGKNVLFDWSDSNQEHNILHVTSPNEQEPLQIVQGPSGFNSGKPVMNKKFMHRFDKPGNFSVVSEGAENAFCTVKALVSASRTATPELVEKDSYVVYKFHKLYLKCSTPNATIHYTIDGSTPSEISTVYDNDNAAIMTEEGIAVLRAIAFSNDNLTSEIFTSQRFYVIPDPNDSEQNQYGEALSVQDSSQSNKDWWLCIPKLKYTMIGVSCVEISWELPPDKSLELISHYQLFMNKISYTKTISANTNRIIVKGLAGGRNYDTILMVYPKSPTLMPQQSNVLNLKCARTTPLGGPIISLKAVSKKNQITLCWQSIDSRKMPIDAYQLLINGERRETIKPKPGVHKVTIESVKEGINYSVIVVAIPKDKVSSNDEYNALISNEFEITLPLDLEKITLPVSSQRRLDKEYYDEYIEIVEFENPIPEQLTKITSHEKSLNLPKTAPYPSYDNYLVSNREKLIENNPEKTISEKLIIPLGERLRMAKRKLLAVQIFARAQKKQELSERECISPKQSSYNLSIGNNEDDVEPDRDLPVPKVGISHIKPGVIYVQWHLVNLPPRDFHLTHYVITLVGYEFGNSIQSEASYECMMDINGVETPAVQHSWIQKSDNKSLNNRFEIEGILDTAIYQICVNAVYRYQDTTEYKKASKLIEYTALGPPLPAKLRVGSTDIQCISLEWSLDQYPRPEFIKGYQLIVNAEESQVFNKNINEFLFKDMQPGRQYDLEVVTLTNWIVGRSQPSNKLNLICPNRPNPPLITQLPNAKPFTVIIGWKPVKTRSTNKHDKILSYKVYVDKKFHGEIYSNNSSSYSYMIDDLVPGKSYHTMVQAFSGEKISYPSEGPKISCIVASEFSNDLSVNTAAPPGPTRVKLAAIHLGGIDVTWNYPEQYGDSTCSGYQLVKNNKCYGEILSPEICSYRISDIEIGDLLNVQIICLTNHPVGKYSAVQNHPDYTMDQPQRRFITNGTEEENIDNSHSNIHQSYPGCLPGPALSVKYTGLVKPATKLWVERVTGYSAMAIFNTSRMNSHFIDPDHFLVSYWPGIEPDDNIITIRTENDYVRLDNLKPTTTYTLQVESRKELKRSEDLIDIKDSNEYKYIAYSQSSQLQFQTASPPGPPSNLCVESTTCHAVKLSWDPPVDNGAELLSIRLDCYPLNVDMPLHIFKELTPDTKSCIIENLSEKTDYRITITAITEEYLVHHKIKEISQIPKTLLSSFPWLPSAKIDVMTSGTDPATQLRWFLKHDSSISLNWKPPRTYGSNFLVNQILCFQEKDKNADMATQIPIQEDAKSYKLTELKIGSKYRIWIEAVVCMKLGIESSRDEFVDDLSGQNLLKNKISHYKQINDNRCVNIISEHLHMRVPAPCEPVVLNLTGYTNETISVYWARPNLYSQNRNPDNTGQKINMFRHLIGYQLLVNDIQQRSLQSNETSCTLVKCKPLNTYNVVLVALTCLPNDSTDTLLQQVNKDIDIDEVDESHSLPLQVKTFADDKPDQLSYILGQYEEMVDTDEPKSIGRIRVEWSLEDDTNVAQFNVIWFSVAESINQRKSFDATTRICYIPVTLAKAVYEIKVVTVYKGRSKNNFVSDLLFIETPGSPEPPSLWLHDLKENVATICWSTPRIYPYSPVSGYQVYLNDIKVSKVDKHHLRTSLQLKMNKSYKINVQALSSKTEYAHSPLSQSLHLITSPNGAQQVTSSEETKAIKANGGSDQHEFTINTQDIQVLSLKRHYEQENENDYDGESTIPIKFSKIAEEYFDLDWSTYIKHGDFDEFKVYWHCLNTNEHFEHRCTKTTFTYRIKKLRSGFTYCIRIAAIKNNSVVINKSKYFVLQTNAPPDSPVPKIRFCNIEYITIEWAKPNCYGDARIVAYKIFVDGKVEAVLSSDQTSFTLSNGTACHEYSFQVQAICHDENYTSLLSAPVTSVWPGIIASGLRQIENENGKVRLMWDQPIIAGNLKISYYRVVAVCQLTNETLVQGPFENNICECEFRNMSVGNHKITLEIYACGISQPFCSMPLFIDFAYHPEPPTLVAHLPGIEQRTKLDHIVSSLCNKRDRLLKIATNNPMSKHSSSNNKVMLPKAMSMLRQLDDALNDCLKLNASFTGYFIVNLNWTCEQPNPMIKLSGFRIYVNDKQYGVDLNHTVRTIRIKLTLERAVHRIYITSFTDKPKTESVISNKIELLSENWFPFSFYCLNNVHSKTSSWPDKGCCSFDDSLAVERVGLSKTREPINVGLLNEPIPAPKCQVLEMSTGKTKSLIEGKSKSGKSTIILFWTKWCLSSIRALNHMVMYAQRNNTQNDYIACHHGINPYDNDNTEEVFDLIKKAGYLDYNIRFVNDIQYNTKHGNIENSSLDLFDVKGVPSILILNRSGYIVWKGRYCAYDYSGFESFMHHTLSECIDAKCPIQNCDICNNEVSIESELYELRSLMKTNELYAESLITPNIDNWTVSRSLTAPTKISTKSLISAKLKPYNITNMNSKARPSTVKPNNICYFDKETNRKVYNY